MIMEDNNIHLPQEIVDNILKRLPVKSLIRFQCLCKNWKNTMKNPFFITQQLQQSTNQPSLIPHRLWDMKESLHLFSLDSNYVQRREIDPTPLVQHFRRSYDMMEFEIIGSVNGLLCVGIVRKDVIFPTLLLHNPATKETKEVHKANNNLLGPWRIGFGFSAISNDYKIVKISIFEGYRCIRERTTKIVNEVQVYSLNIGSWRDIEPGVIESLVDIRRTNVSNNGAIIWVGEEYNKREEVIVSFDIETEVFTLIQVPPGHCDLFSTPTIYDNKLALLQYHPMFGSITSIRLWVIENTCPSGGKWSWIKKYGDETNGHPYLIPMNVWRNKIVGRIQKEFFNQLDNRVCLLNPNTDEVKVFVRNVSLSYDDGIFIHVESLVSPCRRTLI